MNDTTPTTVQELAGEAAGYFETAQRAGAEEGETFTRTKDDAPEWVSDLVRTAHGRDANGAPAFLPDDWRYDAISAALDAIDDAGADADLDDLEHEWADGHVDVYTADRYAWLSSNLRRAGYVDQAAEELGRAGDVNDEIGAGQYMEAREVFQLVRRALEDRAEEIELDADEPDDD